MKTVERTIGYTTFTVRCKEAIGRYEKDKEYNVHFLKLFTGKHAMFTEVDDVERDGRYLVFDTKSDIADHFEVIDRKQEFKTVRE